MPKKQHSEEQIIGAQAVRGRRQNREICRKLGIGEATFYMCKRQYAGLGVQELHELRQLRDENDRLKRGGWRWGKC